MLWIALHLPLLSLESFAAGFASAAAGDAPLALLNAQHIANANAAALALGVKPGLKRATALALAPHLVLGQADAQRDAQALGAVAHTALAFTPSVSIQPAGAGGQEAHTVLLEVERCLRYFGGLDALLSRLHKDLASLGHHVQCVSAPTAQGAAMLARVHARLRCPDLAALQAALDAAPVWLLGPGREHWEALQGMGLRTLADLRRLPRAGVARRFGETLLDELDRARGERPDPREAIALPERFEGHLELFARADSTEQVLQGANVLLVRLVAWLAAQHMQVRRWTLTMRHEKRLRNAGPLSSKCGSATLLEHPRGAGRAGPAQGALETRLEIALAEPSRDPAHLRVLLCERLARLELSAPAFELHLRADETVRRAPPNGELFPAPGSQAEGLTRLIERLQARLGNSRVQRLTLVHDHRPELSSPARGVQAGSSRPTVDCQSAPRALPSHPKNVPAKAQAGEPVLGATAGAVPSPRGYLAPRPVWLLPQPQALPESESRPWWEGRALQLLSGPERIEAGWWDEAGLAERDYFIAQTPDGALLWIYRTRLPLSGAHAPGWFLQGRFA